MGQAASSDSEREKDGQENRCGTEKERWGMEGGKNLVKYSWRKGRSKHIKRKNEKLDGEQ